MDYLLFRLYGSLASWGEIAIGESRHSANYPSKSAILGLIGAALGIDRNNDSKQKQLQEGYHLAVKVYSRGNLLYDYHTSQAPDSVGNFSYLTRRDELVIGKPRLGTILSSREYRTDALALIAVKALKNAPFPLTAIHEHLLKPIFHLYLGRKSCPLSAPLHPQVYSNKNGFHDAFTSYEHAPLLPVHAKENGITQKDRYWLGIGKSRDYYWEGEKSDFSTSPDLKKMQTRIRHDQPISRKRWQFSPRLEHYLSLPGGE